MRGTLPKVLPGGASLMTGRLSVTVTVTVTVTLGRAGWVV